MMVSTSCIVIAYVRGVYMTEKHIDGDTDEPSKPITVKFSVRDKPGALRKALKSFEVSCSRI